MPLPYVLDVALRDRIVNHMLARVQAEQMLSDPFPHMQMRSLFPDDVYARMLAELPPLDQYEAFHYHKHHTETGESNRKRFRFDNECLLKLEGKRQGLWLAVRSALGHPKFKAAVFGKLAEGLAFRYGCQAAAAGELSGFALPELFRETKGYSIAPHPDTRKKVVTMQIALAGDRSQESFGTEFYRRSFQPAHWLREPRGFETVKTMPFLPNVAYAFVVLNSLRLKSWHGRSTLASSGEAVRVTILNIWYEAAENGNQDLIDEQSHEAGQRRAA
jgi:hypothetical protein